MWPLQLGMSTSPTSPTSPREPYLYRKLVGARFRLRRSEILQANTRWKALAEIYTIHTFALLCNLNLLSKICQNFGKVVQNSANLTKLKLLKILANSSNFLKTCNLRAVQRSALYRSRGELSNANSLAKFGFDTAENEPCKVCQ